MTKRQKRDLIRIIAGAALFLAAELLLTAELLPVPGYWRQAAFLVPYLIVGGDVLLSAVKNIIRGQVFDENFLMALATVGAFGVGEYPEGVAVMLFYQVGELFQSYAVGRSRRSITELLSIRPDYANVQRDGKLVQVDPEEVAIGDLITVKAGEKIPLDGDVVEGSSMVDTSALTGESVPRRVSSGSPVLSGCVNQNGLLVVRVTKEFGETTVAKILDLVENASSKKAKAENFITRFARYYTPAVVIAAALLAFVPPLVLSGHPWAEWIHRALIFLVVSCPCALVISIPLGFFGGIGGAGKCGILVKGSNYLEALASAETVVFDKTGTLTKGVFRVTQIRPAAGEESPADRGEAAREHLLETAALAESYSDHPIAASLREAYTAAVLQKQEKSQELSLQGKGQDLSLQINGQAEQSVAAESAAKRVTNADEIAGCGICATVDGKKVLAGNRKLMERFRITAAEADAAAGQAGTVVYVAEDGRYLGYVLIADEIKEDAAAAVSGLKKLGVRRTVMLSGDAASVAESVAAEIGLDDVCAELLPDGKVEKMEALAREKSAKGKLVFVGDGINDAPVLAQADIGVAMGGLGSDAAIEAADIVLMDDHPAKLLTAIRIARKTLGIVRQNVVFALGVKALVLVLGAFGVANMWEAVFADVGVSVIAILNSMRALKTE